MAHGNTSGSIQKDQTQRAAGLRPAAPREKEGIDHGSRIPVGPQARRSRARERQRHRLLLRDPRRGRAAARAARRARLEQPVRAEPGPARRGPASDRRRPARSRTHAARRPADQPDRHGRRHGRAARAARLSPGRRDRLLAGRRRRLSPGRAAPRDGAAPGAGLGRLSPGRLLRRDAAPSRRRWAVPQPRG